MHAKSVWIPLRHILALVCLMHGQNFALAQMPSEGSPFAIGEWFYQHEIDSMSPIWASRLSGLQIEATTIPGAPELIPTNYKKFGHFFAPRMCPPGLQCEVSRFPVSPLPIRLDISILQQTLEKLLRSAGGEIAFSGATVADLVITSEPKPDSKKLPREYYQIRFLTTACVVQDTFPCQFWGNATLVRLNDTVDQAKAKINIFSDPLTRQAERVMLDYIDNSLAILQQEKKK